MSQAIKANSLNLKESTILFRAVYTKNWMAIRSLTTVEYKGKNAHTNGTAHEVVD